MAADWMAQASSHGIAEMERALHCLDRAEAGEGGRFAVRNAERLIREIVSRVARQQADARKGTTGRNGVVRTADEPAAKPADAPAAPARPTAGDGGTGATDKQIARLERLRRDGCCCDAADHMPDPRTMTRIEASGWISQHG